MAQNEVWPRDEITDPPGTNVFSIDIYGFVEDYVSFCTLCGVYSAAVRFARNRRLEYVCCRGRQGEKRPCVSCLRRSELIAQVRQHNYYASYSQGYGEGIPMAPRPKRFAVR